MGREKLSWRVMGRVGTVIGAWVGRAGAWGTTTGAGRTVTGLLKGDGPRCEGAVDGAMLRLGAEVTGVRTVLGEP